MPMLNKITVRFSDIEMVGLIASALELGLADKSGKPKISTFIRVALNSNQLYKNKLKHIIKTLENKDE